MLSMHSQTPHSSFNTHRGTSFHIVRVNIYCFLALELFWKIPGSSVPLWLPKLMSLLCNRAKHPVGRPFRTNVELSLALTVELWVKKANRGSVTR